MSHIRWKRCLRVFAFSSVAIILTFRLWKTGGNRVIEDDADFTKNDGKGGIRPHVSEHSFKEIHNTHVVVGHYVGDAGLLSFPKSNLTQEMLNTNLFSPKPGEGHDGHAVIIPPQENAKMQQLFYINRFNLLASDRIPLNRSLPDVRRKGCKELYDKAELRNLPDVSIIIIFHNEAWSTLLRTVTSVINRSPRSLLKDIILVDDASEREFLGKPLEDYLKTLEVPAHVVRTHVRSGLVRARLLGARIATGKVLVFLDAHCECTKGWLKPLVMRVAEDRTRVVCPVIDIINDNTFAYVRSFELHWGAFNWHLHFRWYTIGSDEIKRRKINVLLPYRTPVMAGGLFAIDRSYFFEVGSYDESMDIWGGENLEISFRIWQCGGSLEISPCSHVGHLFRKSTPYSFPGGIGDILYANLARVALVWMDDWAEFFFRFSPEAAKLRDSVSVEKRLQLRHQLQCRSFRWYLTAVWPEHFLPMEDRFFGQVKNIASNKCIERPIADPKHAVGPLSIGSCYDHGNLSTPAVNFLMQQLFVFTPNGSLMTDESVCMDASLSSQQISHHKSKVNLMGCSGNAQQKWDYKNE
ncbi:hypothetical protein J437_LFUL012979, partial [Ladona fulva]